MSLEDKQDRLDLLEDLGEALIYTANGDTHVSSKSVNFNGIFERAYVETKNVDGYAPVVTADDSDLTGVTQGAMIRRDPNGTYTDYKVVGIEPDGTGFTNLILQEQ